MPNFSKNEIVLVRYPFSDLSNVKVRPAVIVGQLDRSPDFLIVPLTSKTSRLASGEFTLTHWQGAGLNVPTAIKQGIYTIHTSLILKSVGNLSTQDAIQLEQSLRLWLRLS
jgi:mRNA interferase MazF